ncbi:MAG: Rne/Rng family ribonuclease [Acidobacteriota bacterium]|nr:Rne/Rng family ribonuclease [Acidobacteriota bacterium]
MSKEMIISVNGREKKIAILDNGRVTEFYIERGEENSGIAGNIYKGRVQRVLPGMQSAFVEIGLERDGFLYVSDFFDEEEEIERIVMEKSKKSTPEETTREVNDRIQRARLEREKQMESVQEIAEPLVETGAEIPEFTENEESSEVSGFTKISDDSDNSDERETPVFEEEQQLKGRRNRSRRGGKSRDFGDEKPRVEEVPLVESLFPTQAEIEKQSAEAAPSFEIEDSGFERITDDEETTGDLFKDAYMQEAITDQVRAIEFDMEGASTAEVGSLLDAATSAPNAFERIADDDDEQPIQPQAVKSRRGSRGGKTKNSKAEETTPVQKAATSQAQPVAVPEESGEELTEQAETGKTSRSKSRKLTKPTAEKESADESVAAESTTKSASRKKNRGGKKSSKTESTGNAEASVRESDENASMAVRRGGRGRRRPGGNRPDEGQQSSNAEEANENEPEAVESEQTSVSESVVAGNSNNRNNSNGGGSNRRDSREPRDNRTPRDFRDSRDAPPRDNRDSRSSRPQRPPQPTISDLLREGQEILVQIAKEPIAKKGARITSHIALPGRFIVYMPTIEHLGVSRKIESAGERGRLRTLIQKIKQEESVPSGGFIVRTAGVGISEEDLRQDARYLVRTWQDIKKQSEKAKSPAVVHQDLDIIQRLLRDHLSDEYTAIRVDSEEEYLRTIEFVNRIQPKMVSRVKLYTREESILEAYGVQEEIDKALKPRVWLKSGGYLVINQTEALVAIDVNTGKFVGRGSNRLEDTITKTNMEAVDEIARQIRLRDLGGIIVLDLIDMEDRRNRHKVSQALQEALSSDKSPTKVLSFNDFGLIIMTRKRVKQSLERTMCAPCDYCEGAGWVKSPQTICFEILEEARRLAKHNDDVRQTTLRVHPEVSKALRESEKIVLEEIEAYLGNVDVAGDSSVHIQQFDFAFI